ncbi:hypothetical protein MWH25_08600 [Natroniella acetigena]|uniref:hypothetical protein n=1 Tax=Natroniella acetigena TaxID=52004 RepID=UPI00200B7246|nr:hypothetical protein [Natroniella acetigena]MCK8827798.1 hypothetical protein [Natroniella acetigena]
MFKNKFSLMVMIVVIIGFISVGYTGVYWYLESAIEEESLEVKIIEDSPGEEVPEAQTEDVLENPPTEEAPLETEIMENPPVEEVPSEEEIKEGEPQAEVEISTEEE